MHETDDQAIERHRVRQRWLVVWDVPAINIETEQLYSTFRAGDSDAVCRSRRVHDDIVSDDHGKHSNFGSHRVFEADQPVFRDRVHPVSDSRFRVRCDLYHRFRCRFDILLVLLLQAHRHSHDRTILGVDRFDHRLVHPGHWPGHLGVHRVDPVVAGHGHSPLVDLFVIGGVAG